MSQRLPMPELIQALRKRLNLSGKVCRLCGCVLPDHQPLGEGTGNPLSDRDKTDLVTVADEKARS